MSHKLCFRIARLGRNVGDLRKQFDQILSLAYSFKYNSNITIFYLLLTVHLSIILDNDQLDTHLLYFILQYVYYNPVPRFEHYMLIIRRLNCIYGASGIVTLEK